MNKVYLKDKKKIAYFEEKASPNFWDSHWQLDVAKLREHILSSGSGGFIASQVRKYLPRKSLILEGGCGQAQLVYALHSQGYKVIGIDFAQETIDKIKQAVPELDVRNGDVRGLNIETSSLDGYISIGVIEHFWQGYEAIISEMARTIKSKGFLFLSFPYLSPLRRLKIRIGGYKSSLYDQMKSKQNVFYQFLLDKNKVIKDLEKLGFILKSTTPWDGIKGVKDEVSLLKGFLQPIYDGKAHQRIRPYLDKVFKIFAAHSVLLTLQKTQ